MSFLIDLALHPTNLLALLLLAGLSWQRYGQAWLGKALTRTAATLLVVIACLPIANWMLTALENRFPQPTIPQEVTGIIVLGGMFQSTLTETRGQTSLSHAVDRLTQGMTLAHAHPEATLVFTSGKKDPRHPLSGADLAKRFLAEQHFDLSRVVFETTASNTWQNAVATYQQINPNPGSTWLLVTSAAHMPRAVGSFRQAGWSVIPYPVDYKTTGFYEFYLEFDFLGNLAAFNGVFYKWAGLVWYRLQGRSDALFPGP